MVVGFDPVHARSVQRSFTVHGDDGTAERRRRELVDDHGLSRVAFTSEASRLSVAELMERFFDAPHLWKPATVVSHRPVVKALMGDALGRRRLVTLTPGDVRAAICRWQADGVPVPTVSARWLVLRSAISWAVGEGVLRTNPLAGMRGPAPPNRAVTTRWVKSASCFAPPRSTSNGPLPPWPPSRRHRVVADCCSAPSRAWSWFVSPPTPERAPRRARRPASRRPRGSGADDRARSVSGRTRIHQVLRTRRLTLGSTTAALINEHFASWTERGPKPEADWLFAPSPTRETYVTADSLSHKFRRLGREAGVANPALHRLRHGVATHLVDEGKLLKAQARLGHRDPSTTLRHYAHATPLDDEDVADELDQLLNSR